MKKKQTGSQAQKKEVRNFINHQLSHLNSARSYPDKNPIPLLRRRHVKQGGYHARPGQQANYPSKLKGGRS
jgi:hypothetical protein